MKALLYLPIFIVSGFAAPATAQNGAMWVDDRGRRLSMDFSGFSGVPIASFDRSPAEMASLFENVCLSTDGDPLKLVSAADMANVGLTAAPITIPGTSEMPPTSLNIWRGKGAVISQSAGFYAAKFAQCNVLFYPDQLPRREAVTDAIAIALGSAPSNAASATKKNGKLNKSYKPEWTVAFAGKPGVVTAHVWEGSPDIPGSRVQISVRTARKSR